VDNLKAAQWLPLDYEYARHGPTRTLVAGDEKKRRSASMRTTHRRYWVFFLLFLFSAIAYLDRVNMSVAGKPIAQEFALSPVALGYLFSSLLWAYVLMMLPGGRLIDSWGPHVVASVATAVWSTAQMATGIVSSFAAMLIVRLGLGVGEAPFAPISYSSVRLWSPYTERGTAIAAISCGSTLGLALGAPAVGWLIETLSWRWSFIITGAVGFVWIAAWAALISTPEKTGWLPPAERNHILAGRNAGITPPSHNSVGYLGLIRCPAMWGLFISQGCLVYTGYLYISWLPNYLQTARHLSILNSGIYTAIPFLISTVVGVVANWAGDKVLTAEAVRGGNRRYLVVLSLLFTAAGLGIPFVQSLAAVITLITIAVSAAHVGPAANGALVADLLRSPGDAGRATAFLVLGGNTFGLLAPIVTGYVVDATGSFNTAFVVAGALALVGAAAALALVRGTLGEHVRPSRASPRLVS
jgi:MFS family permease